MSAIRELYLDDVASGTLGVWMEKAPGVRSAKERGEWIEIAGRHGETWRGDGTLEGFNVTCELYAPETCDVAAVLDWLRGAERLRWGDHDWEYHVSAADVELEMVDWDDFVDCGHTVRATWRAEPFRYHWPAVAGIVCENPGAIQNPGTAEAAPLIRIAGRGDISLSIGGCVVSVEDMEEGMVLDCEAQMAWNLAQTEPRTGGLLLVGTGSGRWPRLAPGGNAVAWTGLAEVTVVPRWRDR